VTLHVPYMSEMFGTHHTKMMVLLRHDDLAQIVIHTANLIQQDWRNMTQAVWRSPLLPLSSPHAVATPDPHIGSGARFKIDFLNYLRAYDIKRSNCKPLIEQLLKYDFSEIRGALIGSVPGRHAVESERETKWGWQALEHVLKTVPCQPGGAPDIVAQISSIATMGTTDKWLRQVLFRALGRSGGAATTKVPTCKVIFPTPNEIRRSLDGYNSGRSIHMKIEKPAQQKQLEYLKPLLHHWSRDGAVSGGTNDKNTG
jgi:tyrosyl-DNA phosphodiesterase-1